MIKNVLWKHNYSFYSMTGAPLNSKEILLKNSNKLKRKHENELSILQ